MMILSTPSYGQMTPKETSRLAKYIKQCEVNKMDLEDTKKAYNVCTEAPEFGSSWWQSTPGILLIGGVGFILGIGVGVVIK